MDTNNTVNIYKELFETYLSFCPYYRRNLVDLKDMYNWLEDLDMKRKFFFEEADLFILMEWFSAISLIKPLAVLHYPPETFKDAQFTIRTNSYELEKLYSDGLISFPEEIYNINNVAILDIKPWEHRIYKPYADEKEHYRRFTKYDLDHYLYHPIQFFQLLTYLKGATYQNLRKKKQYKEFYWRRRLRFEDNVVERIEKHLEEEGITKEEYIKQESEKGRGFNQFEFIYFKQHRWLIEKALLLWIKFETLYHIKFLRPSHSQEINIELQISLWDSNKEDTYKRMFKEFREWRTEVLDNFSSYFSIEDFNILKGFSEWSEVQLNFDGLDKFKDLFLLIKNEKKSKLKGFLSFYMNILQIVKTLRVFTDKFIEEFPELESEKHEPKWYEPRYYFEEGQEKERNDYLQKIYLDYGLIQEDTYIIYVEGPTELILLEDWLDLVYYRVDIKINIKPLPSGKRTAFMFEYLVKEFNAKEHFLVLDADTPEYIEGKKAQLSGKGISEDSYHIFSPDFVTANFDPPEIIEAVISHFNDISDKIYEATCVRKIILEEEYQEFKDLLENKEEFERYEDLVEGFLAEKLDNPTFELKKTEFANNLLISMRKNLSQSNRSNKYPFEEILGKFVSKIQKKKYPGMDIDF